jgi:cytochrome c
MVPRRLSNRRRARNAACRHVIALTPGVPFRMDSLEVNKAIASVLVAGIAFMAATLVADGLVHPTQLKQSAIHVDVATPAPPASAAPAAPEQPFAQMLATADEKAGDELAHKVCAVCHTFNEGGKAGVGPNLYGIIGAPHAHMAGYDYSDAIKSKKGPWTYDELNEWLTKPSAYAPGTKMSFPGFSSEKQRAEVVSFLRTLSAHPEPLPPATAAPEPKPAAPSAEGTAAPAK